MAAKAKPSTKKDAAKKTTAKKILGSIGVKALKGGELAILQTGAGKRRSRSFTRNATYCRRPRITSTTVRIHERCTT